MDKGEISRYFFYGIVLFLLVLCYFIVKPFFIALITAFVLSYLILPIYKRLEPRTGKNISALICIFLLLIAIIVPTAILTKEVIVQSQEFFSEASFQSFFSKISSINIFDNISINFDALIEKGVSFLINLLASGVNYLPHVLVSLFVIFIGMYYMLTKWDLLTNKIEKFVPAVNRKKAIKKFSESTNGIIYGTLLISLIQFVVCLLGLLILGVKFPILLSVLVFFLGLIPFLGPTLVFLPLVAYYAFVQNWFIAIGVLVLWIILSFWLDTLLRIKIMGKTSNINPFVMLLGILGGVSIFGVFGFIVGPLILVYTIELIEQLIE